MMSDKTKILFMSNQIDRLLNTVERHNDILSQLTDRLLKLEDYCSKCVKISDDVVHPTFSLDDEND